MIENDYYNEKKTPFSPEEHIADLTWIREGSPLFQTIIDGTVFRKLDEHKTKQLLKYVLSERLDDALETYKQPDGVEAPALRQLYRKKISDQNLFDFVVISSLMAYKKIGIDLTKDNASRFTLSNDLGTLMHVYSAFKDFENRIADSDQKKQPFWIEQGCNALGKENMVKWLAAQAGEIEKACIFIYRKPKFDAPDHKHPTGGDVASAMTIPDFESVDYSTVARVEAWGRLTCLVGRDDITGEMRDFVRSGILDEAMATVCGTKREFGYRNFVLEGPPGVGKTTSAEAAGAIMSAEGLLPSKKVIFCSASNFIGQFIGQTEKYLEHLFKQGRGGLIIIDEADVLAQSDSTSYQKTAVNAINTLVGYDSIKYGTVVCMTGYSEGLDALFRQNPGLGSRFPNRHVFAAYDDQTLETIFTKRLEKMGYKIQRAEIDHAMDQIRKSREELGEYFGNARTIETFIGDIKKAHANNLGPNFLRDMAKGKDYSTESTNALRYITKEDIPLFDPESRSFKTSLSRKDEAARPKDVEKRNVFDISYG